MIDRDSFVVIPFLGGGCAGLLKEVALLASAPARLRPARIAVEVIIPSDFRALKHDTGREKAVYGAVSAAYASEEPLFKHAARDLRKWRKG